jgi:HK97 gp10 family phage protein
MPFAKDEAGIGRMLVMPGMIAAMAARAERVADRARSTAPVDEGGPHPGRYRDAFSVSSGVRPKDQDPPRAKIKHDRAYGRVSNDAPEARFVEFGTEHQPAHRTLGRALDAARG